MRDDLWLLFYAFYELLLDQLYWRKTNDKNEVEKLKILHPYVKVYRKKYVK